MRRFVCGTLPAEAGSRKSQATLLVPRQTCLQHKRKHGIHSRTPPRNFSFCVLKLTDGDKSKGLNQAPVHWRLILRNGESLLSHVALTELAVEMNGDLKHVGAVGGLFTPTDLQGLGYGTSIMDRAEEFIFERLKLPEAILFCLPELVSFYTKRRWSLVTSPVTLQQQNGSITWGAAVMLLSVDRSQSGNHHIHVPISSRCSSEKAP